MREALAINFVQKDVLMPVDWIETLSTIRWVLIGGLVMFNWVHEEDSDVSEPWVKEDAK